MIEEEEELPARVFLMDCSWSWDDEPNLQIVMYDKCKERDYSARKYLNNLISEDLHKEFIKVFEDAQKYRDIKRMLKDE